jgi:uncharacterized membrane protein YqiK
MVAKQEASLKMELNPTAWYLWAGLVVLILIAMLFMFLMGLMNLV